MTPREIEAASFRNLVEHHREDLTRIMDGENTTDVITPHRHTYLKKYGILHRIPNSRRTFPTPRAIEILNSQSPSGRTTQ